MPVRERALYWIVDRLPSWFVTAVLARAIVDNVSVDEHDVPAAEVLRRATLGRRGGMTGCSRTRTSWR